MAGRKAFTLFFLPLFFALSGCWLSAEPLLNDTNASEVPFVGQFSDPEGGEEPVVISQGAGMSYELSQGEQIEVVYFMEVSPEWFVIQATDPVKEEQEVELGPDLKGTRKPTNLSTYRLIRWQGENIEMFNPDCNEDILAIDGVEGDRSACAFDDIQGLKLAAESLIATLETEGVEINFDMLTPWED